MDMLTQLEREIADRLSSLPALSGITVLVDPQKNIVDVISTKIAKLKTLIAPLVSGADDNSPGLHGPYFDEIRIDIGIFQNPILKGNDAPCRELALSVHEGLKGWKPDSLSSTLNPRKTGIEQIADRTLNIWNCAFATKGGFIASLPKVATPVSYLTTGGIILATTTTGAAIYYTTDGSNPAPRNGTLFVQPFAALSGTVIKARAFLAGYLTSDALTVTLSANYGSAFSTYRLQLYNGTDWLTLGSDGIPPQVDLSGMAMRFKTGTGVQLQNTDTNLFHTLTAGGAPAQVQLDPEGQS